MFSSIRGKIKIISLAATDLDGDAQYTRILALRHTLSDETGMLIWCNSQPTQQRLHSWLAARNVLAECRMLDEALPAAFQCLLLAPAGAHSLTNYSRWIRDPFVWKWNGNGTPFLLGSAHAKNEDSVWAMLHMRRVTFEGRQVVNWQPGVIPVAGGNILFDEDFVLVGARQYQERAVQIGQEACAQNLLNALNSPGAAPNFRRIIEVGKGGPEEPRRLAHVDLYLSLTGMRESNRYVLLLGRCELLPGASAPGPDANQMVQQLNGYLDAVAAQLTAEGFCVKRNPIPVVPAQPPAQGYLCSYNNCLVELAGEKKPVVWLAQLTFQQENRPYFAKLRQLEQQNRAIWEKLGFEVRLVAADFHSILDEQGSLHCITNELLRTPGLSSPAQNLHPELTSAI